MSKIPTKGDAGLWRAFQGHDDPAVLFELQTLALAMTVEELQRFCEGTMTALVVVQDQYRKRFPREWAAWNARLD